MNILYSLSKCLNKLYSEKLQVTFKSFDKIQPDYVFRLGIISKNA